MRSFVPLLFSLTTSLTIIPATNVQAGGCLFHGEESSAGSPKIIVHIVKDPEQRSAQDDTREVRRHGHLAKAKEWWGCCCPPPPRGEVLDTVAIERVAPPLLRTELVVSRESLRVMPGEADLRSLRPREEEKKEAPTTPKETSAPKPKCSDGAKGEEGKSSGSAASKGAASAGDDTRLSKIESEMETIKKSYAKMDRDLDTVIDLVSGLVDRQSKVLEGIEKAQK